MSAPLSAARPYTGQIGYIAGLADSTRQWLHTESCGLARRLWTEDGTEREIAALTKIRADLEQSLAIVREMEATATTVAEEQSAAMDVTNRDAS